MSVELEKLVKEFRDARGAAVRAVDDVSLHIEAGELVTFLGPSGCGKTTTLRMIAGFEVPTAGTIRIGDRDVTNVPPYARNIPMVFQSYALFPHLTVMENAAFGLKMHGVAPDESAKRVRELAQKMELGHLLERGTHELSGGQQQRVALLRALVTDPEVLLFDEPLSNLDAQMRVTMRNEIRRIQRQAGITAIYVTHDQAEAMSISDRVVVMHEGNIAQVGTPAEIYSRPNSRFVATFLGDANFVPVTVSGTDNGRVAVNGPLGDFSVRDPGTLNGAKQATLVARPECVALSEPGDGARGTIKNTTYLGAEVLYELELDGDLALTARVAHPTPDTLLRAGDSVNVSIDDKSLHLLPD